MKLNYTDKQIPVSPSNYPEVYGLKAEQKQFVILIHQSLSVSSETSTLIFPSHSGGFSEDIKAKKKKSR